MIAKSNKKNIYLIANVRILKRPVRLLLYYRTNNATSTLDSRDRTRRRVVIAQRKSVRQFADRDKFANVIFW